MDEEGLRPIGDVTCFKTAQSASCGIVALLTE